MDQVPSSVPSRRGWTGRRTCVCFLAAIIAGLLGWVFNASSDPLREARRLAARGEIDQACSRLQQIVNDSPEDSSTRVLLAKLRASTNPGAALHVLSVAPTDAPGAADVARLFDEIVAELEQQNAAGPVLDDLSVQHPQNLWIARAQAAIAIRSGDLGTAERAARRAAELAPEDAQSLLLLADALDGLGRRISMIAPLRRELELDPDSYVAHANLAYALRHAGDLDEASEHARWCLERNSADPNVRTLLGQILREQGRIDDALAVARQVIDSHPDHADARVLEAELLIHGQEFEAAVASLMTLDDLQLQRHDIRELLGRARRLATIGPAEKLVTQVEEQAVGLVREIRFVEMASDLGLDFHHRAPLTDERHTHLVMGGGLGWLDWDHDGWPDIYFGQGRPFDSAHPLASDSVEPDADRAANDCLYRNLDGQQFDEVTDQCRIQNPDYATGIAVGDWNNDGFDDVFVGCFGPNRLFVNLGDGTFIEQSESSGLDDPRFAASATWFDADNDGNLDLFVTSYLDLDPYNYHICHATRDGRDLPVTCHPRHVNPVPDVVYRNLGESEFMAITDAAGFAAEEPRQGLGIVAADFDLDGDSDVYVANDAVPNQLWRNDGSVFHEQATVAGVALNRAGEREAGMGVAVGDVTGNGLPDLFVTNYFSETNTLYRNEGSLLFADVTDESGLGHPSRPRLGFGATLLDANSDGWLDLFVSNGHVNDRIEELGDAGPFAQKALMFANLGGGRFQDVSETAGECCNEPVVGRGSAAADFDRDGRVDIAVQRLNGPCRLLKNDSAAGQGTLQIQLIGTVSSRSAIGAMVTVSCSGRSLMRMRNGSTSYLSCDEGILSFALDAEDDLVEITVRWPDGRMQTCSLKPGAKRCVIVEGHQSPVVLP